MDPQNFVKMARNVLDSLGLPNLPVRVVDYAVRPDGMAYTMATLTDKPGQGYAESIEFPSVWLGLMTPQEAEDSLRHEAAHAQVGPDSGHDGHGPEWQAQAIKNGASPKATGSLATQPNDDQRIDLMIGAEVASIFGPQILLEG